MSIEMQNRTETHIWILQYSVMENIILLLQSVQKETQSVYRATGLDKQKFSS